MAKKKRSEHVTVYRTRSKKSVRFSFRKIAGNGQNVGNPSGSYASRQGARRAAKRQHPGLSIVST